MIPRQNTTCDIFHAGHGPPGDPPDVAGVPCLLKPDFVAGQEHGERPGSAPLTWTHVMLVNPTVDVRDGYLGGEGTSAGDSVFIPNQSGTQFLVRFVERVNRNEASDHKRVYLDRQLPGWPTDNL